MRYITFLFLIITFGLAQIQYGGIPKYQSETNSIKFISTENLEIIDRDLHPMVLKYANQYFVDINFLTEATLVLSDTSFKDSSCSSRSSRFLRRSNSFCFNSSSSSSCFYVLLHKLHDRLLKPL